MSHKLSRDEFRQRQELDAARKAGTIEAERDVDTGLGINPHIPQYVSQAPWYIDTGEATLRHQRQARQEPEDVNKFVRRGLTKPPPKKYRPGACENCGSMTHKRKDCVERPRKKLAKFSGKDLKGDEFIENPEDTRSYAAKRDRWVGHDESSYISVIRDYEEMELLRKKRREEEYERKAGQNADSDSDSDDDFKYADTADMAGQKLDDTKGRMTVRNLRIREDTAKYLLNLDVNSAYYDPKTRSMRADPTPHNPDAAYKGDNFVRHSGDAKAFTDMQMFAWEAAQRGAANIIPQADPTAAEMMRREFMQREKQVKDDYQKNILDTYGGHEHLKAPPRELLLAQSENYAEYDASGNVLKGDAQATLELSAAARSKYEEDVFPGNHTSVWGSYWVDGTWGFACCHQTLRQAYCTGEAGRKASAASRVAKEA